MNNINERIRAVREHHQLSQTAFGDKLAKSMRAVQSWESGISEPPLKTLRDIAEIFEVSPVWLITGEGEMFSGSSQQKPAADINQEILKEIIIGLERGLNDTQTTLSPEVKAEIVLLYYNDYVKQTKQIDNIIDFREVIGKDILRTIKTLKIV